MQERVTRDGDVLRINSEAPPPGANIRRRGEQFTAGELLLTQGLRLTPPAIGLLASAGYEEVEASFKPWVTVVRTGGEFIEQGRDTAGRIHSSNEWMLFAALHQELCEVEEEGAYIAGDDETELTNVLRQAAAADVVITTGGVSVGDHDLLAAVLQKMGARIHFHGVAQKPGKPMLFAELDGKPVFCLPGNPRAVMVLYWTYVLPFLRAMQGDPDPGPRTDMLPLATALRCKGDRTEFRAARLQGGSVHPLPDEGSHMLRSLTSADALLVLPPGERELREGDPVEVHLIP
jgi:molybdopterin molybdotransferase